jgi:hypothetical protein
MQTARARTEVIGLENVSLFYPSKTAEVHALDGISLAAADREFVDHVRRSTRRTGSLLNSAAHRIAQTRPGIASRTNTVRQLALASRRFISGNASAAPTRAPEKRMPCARPRSALGSQL